MRPLPLPEGLQGVEVWQLRLDCEAPTPWPAWQQLDRLEAERARRFRHSADRVRMVMTRAALRLLLAQKTERPPRSLRFRNDAAGKPRLVSHPQLAFNVSHAGGFALLAVSETGAIGVDIERCDPALATRSVAAEIMSEREWAEWNPDCAASAFYARWVGKEAVLKALGLGIGDHLKTLSVSPDEAGRYRIDHAHADWPPLSAWSLGAPQGYAAAVARAAVVSEA